MNNQMTFKRYETKFMLTKNQKKTAPYHNKWLIPCKDTQIMRELDYSMHRYDNLAPSIMISYEREAFYGKQDKDFRMTFDGL